MFWEHLSDVDPPLLWGSRRVHGRFLLPPRLVPTFVEISKGRVLITFKVSPFYFVIPPSCFP